MLYWLTNQNSDKLCICNYFFLGLWHHRAVWWGTKVPAPTSMVTTDYNIAWAAVKLVMVGDYALLALIAFIQLMRIYLAQREKITIQVSRHRLSSTSCSPLRLFSIVHLQCLSNHDFSINRKSFMFLCSVVPWVKNRISYLTFQCFIRS